MTPDNQVILRSNVSPGVLRSFGEDLKNVADELDTPPEPGAPDALTSKAIERVVRRFLPRDL